MRGARNIRCERVCRRCRFTSEPSPATTPRRVCFPGTRFRAQYIAETFFEDAREVNRERGMLGFTGVFRGRPVSVQASGMGCPSAAIVIEELGMLGVKLHPARRDVRRASARHGARRPDRRDQRDSR